MAENTVLLITGRTINQGKGVSGGKEKDEYQNATRQVELCPVDMIRLSLQEGDPVRLVTRHGNVVVHCKAGNLFPGLAFMAFGPAAGQLVGGETQASGMPDSKGFEVQVNPV